MSVDSFGQVPTYIARHAVLSLGAKALASVIGSYERGSNAGCFASIGSLALDLNISRRHCKRLLDELLDWRCVTREVITGKRTSVLRLVRNASQAVTVRDADAPLRRIPTRRPLSAGRPRTKKSRADKAAGALPSSLSGKLNGVIASGSADMPPF